MERHIKKRHSQAATVRQLHHFWMAFALFPHFLYGAYRYYCITKKLTGFIPALKLSLQFIIRLLHIYHGLQYTGAASEPLLQFQSQYSKFFM